MNIDQEPEADLEFCYYSGSESEVDDSPTVMSNTSTIQDEQHEIAQHSVESSIENATEVGETLHNFTEDNAHIEADVIMISSDEEDDDRATMTRKSIEPKQDDASIMTTLQTDRQSVLYKFQPAPLIFVSTDEEEEEEEEITVKSEPVEDIPKKNVEISDGSIRNILLRDGHQKRALLHMRRIKKKIKKLAKKKATQKTIKPIEEKQCQIIENEPQQIAETEPDTQQPDDQSQEHIENEKAKVKPIVSTPIRKSQRQISKQNRIAQMSEDQKANVSENQKAKVPEKSKPDLVTPIPNADESSEFNEETPSNDITKLSLTFKPIGDSTNKFTDSAGNIYRMRCRLLSRGQIYLRCLGLGCGVSATYSFEEGTVEFRGEHSNHPSLSENEIRVIELSQVIRTKSTDPKFSHWRNTDIYDQCVSEFPNIILPDDHRKRALSSIAGYRSTARKQNSEKFKQNSEQLKQNIDQMKQYTGQLKQINEETAKVKQINQGKKAKINHIKNVAPNKIEEKQLKFGVPIGFKAIAGSKALYKDSADNVYRRMVKGSDGTNVLFFQCQWKNCTAIISHNYNEPKVLRMVNKHSDHPSATNDIPRIELSRFMRAKALDMKYKHVKSADIYEQCLAEYKGVSAFMLPEIHRKKSIEAIEQIRKHYGIQTA